MNNNINLFLENELKKFDSIFETAFSSDDILLNSALNHLYLHKGKMFRPVLTFLAAKISGDIQEDTYYLAASYELIHLASLVHDDVIDNSTQRRNNSTLNSFFDNKTAVLVGDYLITKAMSFVNKTKSLFFFEYLQNLSMNLVRGEILQQYFSHNFLTEEEYFKIITLKTAALFAASAETGSISGRGEPKISSALYDFGKNLGICFQIKDDIFDYSPKNNVGKPALNDIREGKITLPLLYSLNYANKDEQNRIFDIINEKNISNSDTLFVISLIDKYKGIDYAKQQMQIYRDKAENALRNFDNSINKKYLIELLNFSLTRDY
jgi:octaprenyl-diphosphate synthase